MKEKQIFNILNYLNKVSPYDCSKLSDKTFCVKASIISDKYIPSNIEYDNCDYSINFDTKSIKGYFYLESGHNGDHYNCKYIDIPWSALDDYSYSRLKSFATKFVAREINKEIKDKLLESKFSSIENEEIY